MYNKYYAVRKGRQPGLYRNWEDARQQVDKYPGAEHRAFFSENEALDYLERTTTFLSRSLIGVGGFCDVYKVSENIVEKVLRSKTEDSVKRFKREIEIIQSVDSPNIIKIIEASNSSYTMKMYDYNYETFVKQIGASVLPMDVFFQVLDGVEFLHTQNILHRDLKPQNILLNKEGEVVLSDFGLSKYLGDPSFTQTRATMGTPLFMAPEQIIDSKRVGATADIFSLGKILDWTITTLELESNDGLNFIIDKATRAKPEDRFQSVSEFRSAILKNEEIRRAKLYDIDKLIERVSQIGIDEVALQNVILILSKASQEEFEGIFRKILRFETLKNGLLQDPNNINYFEQYLSQYISTFEYTLYPYSDCDSLSREVSNLVYNIALNSTIRLQVIIGLINLASNHHRYQVMRDVLNILSSNLDANLLNEIRFGLSDEYIKKIKQFKENIAYTRSLNGEVELLLR